MQPWQVSTGLSLALLIPLYLAVSYELSYMAPFWSLAWQSYAFHLITVPLAVYMAVVFGIYQIARVLVLGDVGSRLAVFDKTIRQGRAGDAELSKALVREETGDYES